MAFLPALRRLIPLVGIVALGLCAARVGWAAPGSCRVWFLDVGEGEAELVETPGGQRVLIDGGPDRSVLAKLGSLLPPWDRRLDAAILTSPEAEAATGLAAVLDRYRVGTVYDAGLRGKGGSARAEAAVSPRRLRAGDRLDLGGASLEVLAPADTVPGSVPDVPGAFSLVLRLSCGEHRILFTGNILADQERRLIALDPRADILVVARHGSLSASDPAFLDAVHPSAAVIEVGANHGSDHPHPAVLDRLNTRGIQTWRTDRDGDLLFSSSRGSWSLASRPLPF